MVPLMEMSASDSGHRMCENSDHPDLEYDHEVHPIPVAPQTEQVGPAGEAGRGQAQVHGGARARRQARGNQGTQGRARDRDSV